MREFWERHPKAEAVLVLVFGVLLAGLALGGYFADRGLAERGVVTTATVLSVDRGRDMDTYEVTYEVVGEGVVTSETAFAVGDYASGDQMQVEYDAEDPKTVAEVGARDGVWLLYVGFGVASLVLLGRCGWLLRRARRGQVPLPTARTAAGVTVDAMRQDLSPERWDAVEQGVLTSPDGRSFTRRTTRAKRRDATALVEDGCPVVVSWPGGLPQRTELQWHDGEDARQAFAEVRTALTSDAPEPRRGAAETRVDGRPRTATPCYW